MTDKERIIDGIDVSECGQSYYDCDSQGNPIKRIKCHREYNDRIYHCDEFHNCNFKQLKHKERECKEQKDHIKFIQETNNLLYNEKKDILMNIDNIVKEFEIESIKDVRTGKIIYRSKKLLKYKSALSEIEKYCEEQNLKYDNTACDILNIINNTEEKY